MPATISIFIKKFWYDQRLLFGSFFILVVVSSLFMYRDFGISSDEPRQAQHLDVSAKSYFKALNILKYAPLSVKNAPDVKEYAYKYYGVASQYPLVLLEFFPSAFNPDQPLFWETRHLYTRALFILAGVVFFFLIRKMTRFHSVMLIGLLLFFLHPRILAHSFYNIKDSVFLSFFTYSMYFLVRYIQRPTKKNMLVLGIISAFTVNIRMMGLLVPIYSVVWTIYNCRGNIRNLVKTLATYTVTFLITIYLIWPVLWGNPIQNFLEAFNNFSNYTAYQGVVLFNGRVIDASKLPSYYIPAWVLITSPFAHFLVWCLAVPVVLIKSIINFKWSRLDNPALFSLWFIIISYGSVVILKSTLYDDWRHLYYLFTPLMVLGVYGLDYLRGTIGFRAPFYAATLVIMVSLVATLFWMVKNYPHYYAYFNILARSDFDQRWERDYWALSTKQLIVKLVDTDTIKKPRKYYIAGAGHSTQMLSKDIRERVEEVPRGSAMFVVGGYRTIVGDYDRDNLSDYEDLEEFIDITVDGKKISTFFKRKSLFDSP